MASKDPVLSPKKLEEGERVVAYVRRRRLENVLTGVFFVGVLLLFLASYQNWRYGNRMALFSLVVLAAVPVGVIVNTHHWMTDRRLVRVTCGLSTTAWSLEGLTPRATKGRLGDDLSFDAADGTPAMVVRSVDNAADVLAAHAGLKDAPATASDGAAPATPPEETPLS